VARNGSAELSNECLMLGVKPTSKARAAISVDDPTRESATYFCCDAKAFLSQ
jgi:hypothetical protein